MNSFGSYMEMDQVTQKLAYTGEVFKSSGTSDAPPMPRNFKLNQNYPNPFNPETHISFDLTKPAHVKLDVININGQKVMTLIDDYREVGHHEAKWDGINSSGETVASGIYLYRLITAEGAQVRKMQMMK